MLLTSIYGRRMKLLLLPHLDLESIDPVDVPLRVLGVAIFLGFLRFEEALLQLDFFHMNA